MESFLAMNASVAKVSQRFRCCVPAVGIPLFCHKVSEKKSYLLRRLVYIVL